MKYSTTVSRAVLIGYVCSRCKSLILLEGTAVAHSASNSSSLANDLANSALADAIHSLENAHVKPFRVTRINDFDEKVFYYKNLNKNCPFCGHHELWQNSNDKGLEFQPTDWSGKTKVFALKGIPEENSPHYLVSADAVNLWKKSAMDKVVADTITHWRSNTAEGYRVRGLIGEKYAQIDALNQQVQAIDSGIQPSVRKLEELKQEVQKYSMFSAEKKTVKGQIKELEKQISAYNKEYSSRRHELTMQIAKLKDTIAPILIENPGVLCKMESGEVKGDGLHQFFRFN